MFAWWCCWKLRPIGKEQTTTSKGFPCRYVSLYVDGISNEEGEFDMDKHVEDNANAPATLTMKLEMKMRKQIAVTRKLKTVRELFETGLLEGCPAYYYAGKGPGLPGRIRAIGICCPCKLCCGRKAAVRILQDAAVGKHHVSDKIIRYSFFGMKEVFGTAPSLLEWLRYGSFLLLYPTGISSEVGLIYIALPFIKNSEKYCVRMSNKWNFSFDYFCAAIAVLGIYVPGSPHMYNYMRGQRKKVLSRSKRD